MTLIRLINAEGTTAAMSKVDAHHHIWDRGVREQSWMVGPAMDLLRRSFSVGDVAAGVTATVLVQTVGVP